MERRKFLTLGATTIGTATLVGCLGGQQPQQNNQNQDQEREQQTQNQEDNQNQQQESAKIPEKNVKATEWKFEPNQFTVKSGQKIRIVFENKGKVTHNLTIGKFPIETRGLAKQDENNQIKIKSETISPGKTDNITLTFSEKGEFPFWCNVSGHRQAGMKGKIIVE